MHLSLEYAAGVLFNTHGIYENILFVCLMCTGQYFYMFHVNWMVHTWNMQKLLSSLEGYTSHSCKSRLTRV